jgi:hypothetical protein
MAENAVVPGRVSSWVYLVSGIACFGLSVALAHWPVVSSTLRVIGVTNGAIGGVAVWHGGAGWRGATIILLVVIAQLLVPEAPLTAQQRNAQLWFFIALGTLVFVASMIRTFRDGRWKLPPEEKGPSGG